MTAQTHRRRNPRRWQAIAVPLFFMPLLGRAQNRENPESVAPFPSASTHADEPRPIDEVETENLTAADAVRLALEALDRLERPAAEDDREALVAEVRRYAEFLQRRNPADPWIYYLTGRYLALRGRQGDAIRELRKFVETPEGRNEWRAYVALGDLFAGEFPQLAKANYEKARTLNPNEPAILLGLSTCAAKLGASEEAIARAREAVALDGRKTPGYLAHLARLLLAVDRLDEALKAAEAARDLAEQGAEGRRGELRPLQTLDRQIQLLVEILRRRVARSGPGAVGMSEVGGPAPVADYLRLAELQRTRGELAKKFAQFAALAAIEEGVNRTSPKTPPTLLEAYGAALADIGREEEATEVFRRLQGIEPENAAANQWLDRVGSEGQRSD